LRTILTSYPVDMSGHDDNLDEGKVGNNCRMAERSSR
jgi:hypothetical protein